MVRFRFRCPFCVVVLGMIGCDPPTNADDVFSGTSGEWVELTHPLSSESVFWPTAEPFELEQVAFGMTPAGYFYAANNFSTAEHGGTHLDAPIHFSQGKMSVEEIPLASLIGPAVVIDVTDHVTPDYLVTVADLSAWEAAHGPIPDGAIVLLRTGWSSRWPDAAAYLGTDQKGPEAIPLLHFPGLDPDAARWLVAERNIDAIGIDTASIDYGQSSDYLTHQIIYGANIPGFENVAHLERLPESGAFVIALPTMIVGGSGAPLRIVGFVPQ